jgi:hypothetical protein
MRWVLLDGGLNALGELLTIIASGLGLLVAWWSSVVVAIALRVSDAPGLRLSLACAALGAVDIAAGAHVLSLAFDGTTVVWLFIVLGTVSIALGAPLVIAGALAARKAHARDSAERAAAPPRCPRCRERALQQIGVSAGEASGGMFGLEGTEWRCTACGEITFRKREP